MKRELDGRRKYYLVLDCETATLPYAAKYDDDTKAKQRVAIAKPLVYDIGWTVIDKQGRIYKKKNFLISEIFSVPSIFGTAYYKEKRPVYLEQLKGGAIDLVTWDVAMKDLVHDMELVEGVGAYNAMFDFKKAIPFTELYINELYSENFDEWEKFQESCCDTIARGARTESGKEFDPDIFRFRGKTYRLFDVWGLACRYVVNNDKYRSACVEENWQTDSGKYFKTSAEVVYRFCADEKDFIEAHTALNDAEIESFLFGVAVKKNKNRVEFGIIYFPFRELGTVDEYLLRMKKK